MLKVYLRPDIQDIELVQIGATIEVSETADFTELVYTTGDSISNRTIFHLPVELTPSVTYYIRARLIHEQGLTAWFTESFVAVAIEVNEVNLYPTSPIETSAPLLETEVVGNVQPRENFKVRSLFQSPAGNPVVSTSWIIEDISGEVVYYLPMSIKNLYRLEVDFTLDKNKVYVIKCRHMLKSNDSTPFGSIVLYTNSSNSLTYLPNLLDLRVDNSVIDIYFKIPPYTHHLEYNVYYNWSNILSGVSLVESKNKIDISDILLSDPLVVVVQVRAVNVDETIVSEWEYLSLDIGDDDRLLPHTLPYFFEDNV